MNTDLYVQWTAKLIDPTQTAAVGDGSGRTPEAAMQRLVEHLRWKANREHEKAGRVEAALERALRDSPLDVARPRT